METRTDLSDKEKLKSIFKNHFSRDEVNKYFPDKEISYMQVHYIKHQDYQKGDVISNLDGMTIISIEFTDGSKESIRWHDHKKWTFGDGIDPSPLLVNSLLNKGHQDGIKSLPVAENGYPNPK